MCCILLQTAAQNLHIFYFFHTKLNNIFIFEVSSQHCSKRVCNELCAIVCRCLKQSPCAMYLHSRRSLVYAGIKLNCTNMNGFVTCKITKDTAITNKIYPHLHETYIEIFVVEVTVQEAFNVLLLLLLFRKLFTFS